MSEELVYHLALELIPGVGSRGAKQLVSYCGSAEEVLKASKDALLKIPGVGEKAAKAILTHYMEDRARQIIQKTEDLQGKAIHFMDNDFPERLKQIPDAPNILFVKGNGSLNPKKSISIVGSRNATEYGKRVTDQIIEELTPLSPTIVSGLAYGIDIQAHKAALNNHLPTVAVMAGGLDQVYPSVHKKYLDAILTNGNIITENVLGVRPETYVFHARNRIIAAMTDATIIVESAKKGGALITARQADSYDKIVFAVPGNIGNEYSSGTNRLIASQKALIYTGVNDLFHYLNWDIKPSTKKKPSLSELTENEIAIYHILSQTNKGMEIDQIVINSQLSIGTVASNLLSLEFKNLIKSSPGKKYSIL